MKVLAGESNVDTLNRTAGAIMETVPRLMGRIRHLMYHHFPTGVGMPQYRALGYVVRRASGVSLTELADHQGLTLASASKLVDALVQLGYLARAHAEDDRRKVVITPTETGIAILAEIRLATQGRLTDYLAGLESCEQDVIIEAMQTLQQVMDARRSRHHHHGGIHREEQ